MAAQARKAGRPPRDPSHRLARAHRILDITGDLVLRWGYDKTTVEDIARRAGVAKGTIYLHWRTREEMFSALLRRERVEMLVEVRRRLEEGSGTLRELLRLFASELMRRPLMRASVLGDSEVLGRLIRDKRDRAPDTEPSAGLGRYLGVLREHGTLRTDLSPAEHVTVLTSVMYGFLLAPRMTPEGHGVSDDRLAELLADAASRAVESGVTVPPDGAHMIKRATLEYVDIAVEAARRKLHASLGSEKGAT
ncbi:AcrR family transcriptional regulator [Streptosporangium becharense]|uniref:AcrR family transcriptional regulator n=1 Tax=Streptosporangium becharense TaxID=1816182 RepID=A0A7W9IE62_9ACTN|nr:TetR/AcrR family transcriptional regulator [Streptosporangium becharense]MBB2912084.1 AcrR family transcriptional regulator [Streptosporangium becharense]MBB5818631.1 AcrR family transcriptional regulator [Streptosporangium becharense]